MSIETTFTRFAEREAGGSSPLYEKLAAGVADDEEMRSIAAHVPNDQPAPNLLFGAVQFLLLEQPDHPLAEYYPGMSDSYRQPDDETYSLFREFCLTNQAEILQLLSSRRVQTNVVRRCAVLLPVFEYISRRCQRTPLGLVEVGPSAGVNLLWDKYGYEFGECGMYGNGQSPVQISSRVRGDRSPPFPESSPPVGSRLGIDLNRLDVRNADDVRWLYALIWPEHTERRSLLEGAVSVAKNQPPTLFEGDALAELPSITERVPTEEQLCLFNTHVLYQLTPEQGDEFAEVVERIGRDRDLFWMDCEWYGEEPEVRFTEYVDGERTSDVLANYDAHGRWIEWVA